MSNLSHHRSTKRSTKSSSSWDECEARECANDDGGLARHALLSSSAGDGVHSASFSFDVGCSLCCGVSISVVVALYVVALSTVDLICFVFIC
jgi:hypothetical protein